MPAKPLDFKTDILPFLIATIGEFVALSFWLRYQNTGQFFVGQLLLWVGFLIERSAVILWLRYVNGANDPESIAGSPPAQIVLAVVVMTVIEIIIWAVWLKVADGVGMLAGLLALAIMIHSLHSVEMAIVKKAPFGTFFANRNTLFFSLMEIIGGTLWLVFVRNGNDLVGSLILLVGLSVEHILQGASLKQDNSSSLGFVRT